MDSKEKFVDKGGKSDIMKMGDVANMNSDLLKGAITGALDPDSKEAFKHAEVYYDEVRKMKTDYIKIAKNINWKEKDILDIKNHIFIDRHDLGRKSPCCFDADYHMAQAWQRLIDGRNIGAVDYVLLQHELMELKLMQDDKMSYSEAHELTNKTYNYSEMIKEGAIENE